MSSIPDTPKITPEELVQTLRALRERVPDFVLLKTSDLAALTRAASVDVQFLHSAINAVAASTALRDALGYEAEELRQTVELTARWSQVVAELDAFRLGVTGAIKVRRHRVGATALQVYQLSRQLARYDANSALRPHIDAMRRVARSRSTRPRPAVPAKPLPGPVM